MANSLRRIGSGVAGGFRRFTRAAWWVHVVATLAAVLLLVLTAAGVLAILYVDYVREHSPLTSEIPLQSEPAAEERAELARRFAPVLRYHSQELFVPLPRAAYVSRTQLKEQEGRFVRVVRQALLPDDLPDEEGTCLRSRGCLFFLDVRGVEPDPPKGSQRAYDAIENQLLRTTSPTVYSHVTRYDDTGEYAVQYWFLYFFNFRLNEHESDWEQITVRLDADRNPVDVFYSSHEGGEQADWERVERDGERPVVYPALGSHANYFAPGRHRVQVGCRRVIGSIRRCFRGRRILVDLADGRGRALRPDDYELSELAGPVFVGSYGTGNYVVLTRQPSVLSDPRTRALWADPLRPLR
ncbi:MAG: Vps62-related protein [Actinomycetota bacterium]|nr:Vps62-related protein [Actinomycetota bacterium]